MTSKYHRQITKRATIDQNVRVVTVSVDVYDVLKAFNVTNPATQHAIKKLLMPGERGHKGKVQDLTEARQSIDRAIELETDDV